ncbi:MAG: hypothetical protein AB1679_34665 [Actinomycetota bacterium]
MLARAGLVVAAVLGGAGPILLPSGAPAASASEDNRLAEMASPSPTRGLVYTGLTLGKDGTACEGVFEAKSRTGASLGCSHGPDPAPPGVDVRRGRDDRQLAADIAAFGDAGSAAAAQGSIGCIGDGVSGARVQAIYAVAADRTDRSATVIPAIRANYAPRIDWQFNQSAAETGGEAHVAFVTEPDGDGNGCRLSVAVARLSASGDDSFSNTMSELKAKGFNRKDRKYLVWADANVLCGVGSMFSDDRPGLNNLNNGYAAMYARVDSACWGHAEAHELMHNLGAVQENAPHATANGHCNDEPDDMCYDDDGNGPATMITVCPGRNGALFDCNHDDYFYAGTPPALNWLATHWNTFNSHWLWRGPLPGIATVPPPTGTAPPPTTTTTAPPPTTTTTRPPTTPTPGPAPTVPVVPPRPSGPSGYWMLTADGHVHPFGAAAFHGQPHPLPSGGRAVDLEPTPSGHGYWTLDDSGRVRAYGDAGRYGSVPFDVLDFGERAVSLSATPTGHGYWVFTSRGRAVTFGDAGFFGDVASVRLNRPVIGSVATPSGRGYFMFASDGGIFTFGDAAFLGSTGAIRLNKPIVGMSTTRSGTGYWLVAADGGLFAFADAGFFGSLGGVRLNRPISAVVPGGAGYLMVGEDGGAFSFGDVAFFGSLGGNPPATPVVSVALRD